MYHVTFPQRSNRASWTFIGVITDLDGNPIDLSACSMVFSIRGKRGASDWYGGYSGFDNYGDPNLEASTDNGALTIIGLGTFQWVFTLDQMRSLCPGTYNTGLTLTNNDGTETVQLFVGPLAIIDGVVP